MMCNYLKELTLFILLFILSQILIAQDTIVIRDFETWVGSNVEKKILNKKLSFNLSQEFRLINNSSQLEEFFTELSVNYKITNKVLLGFGYRFIEDKNNDAKFVGKQRISFDLNYNYKINRLKINSRFKYQNKDEINSTDDLPVNKFRFRIKGTYKIRDSNIKPFISSEIFYAKETITDKYIDKLVDQNGFQKIRFTFGTKYKIKKTGNLKFFYRVEYEFENYSDPYILTATYHILGLYYKFSF